MKMQSPILALLGVFLLALGACSSFSSAAPPAPTEAPSPPAPDSAAPVNAWVTAFNAGETDAVLALFDDTLSFTVYGQTAADKDQLRPLLEGFAGMETRYRIMECRPRGDNVVCTMRVVDACLAASGARDGLQIDLVFTMGKDGRIQKLVGAMSGLEWTDYLTQFVYPWLSWIRDNHMDEADEADASADRRVAGAILANLCRAYAKSLTPTEAEARAMSEGEQVLSAYADTLKQCDWQTLSDPLIDRGIRDKYGQFAVLDKSKPGLESIVPGNTMLCSVHPLTG